MADTFGSRTNAAGPDACPGRRNPGELERPEAIRPRSKEATTMTNLRRLAVWIFTGAVAALVGVARPTAQTADTLPLQLEVKIPLGEVAGRIDHLAVDLSRQRLFVAELGNDSV